MTKYWVSEVTLGHSRMRLSGRGRILLDGRTRPLAWYQRIHGNLVSHISNGITYNDRRMDDTEVTFLMTAVINSSHGIHFVHLL